MNKLNKGDNLEKDYRYEVKFVSYNVAYNNFLHWLKTNRFYFKKFYPNRWVNNIYFDTVNLDALDENLAGISERKKVRYRWYGENLLPTEGQLEIKHKKNNLGWKEAFAVDANPSTKGGAEYNEIISAIKDKIPETAKFYLNIYSQPVLFNRYYREYYETLDRTLRVTVDRYQRFCKQNSSLSFNCSEKAPVLDTIIVEVKCDHKYRELASELVQDIPLRQSRYSKFVEGMVS